MSTSAFIITLGAIGIWLVGSMILLKLWSIILDWLIDRWIDRTTNNEIKSRNCHCDDEILWVKKYKESLTEESVKRLFELEGRDMFVS